MSISITIDNDRVAAGIQNLIEDESGGTQTPATLDTGNEIDVTLSNPVGGTLGGFVTTFNNFLNNSSNVLTTTFGAGLALTDAQKVFAAAKDGASSSADFVKVTTSNGEIVSDLFFSDSAGQPLNGDQVFLADGTTPMQTVSGDNIYLWSSGDFAIATTSSTAGAGRIVAAFYLNDSDPNHLQASVQMVTFEALKHPDATSADDALNFSNILQVSAAGSQSFDFNGLKSSGALWVGVGTNQSAIVVSGYSLDVDGAGKLDGSSNKIAISQGGDGTTIGLNNQLFDNVGERAVFTLVTGLDSLTSTYGGILSDYIVDHTGPAAEGLNYTGYSNVIGAGIYISQSQATPTETKDFDIDLYHAGGVSNTPEVGFGYIGTEPSGSFLDDTPVNVATVTIRDDDNNIVATWVAGADPDGAGPLLGSGATIHHVSTQSGAAGNNVTVTISANNIDVGGVLGGYTVSWTSAGGATFNRFTLKDEGAGKFDVGRVDLIQGVASHTPVGGNLIVQDDGPTLSGSTITKAVGEDALSGVAPDLSTGNADSGDLKTDKVSYSYADIAGIVTVGTDSPAITSLVSSFAANTAVKDINGNAITSGGDAVFWAVSGGVVQGVTAGNRVIFTITDDVANSEFDVDLNDQIDHHDSLGAPLGDEGVTTLNLTPAFKVTDKDLDPATLTGNLVKLDVENDVPVFTAQVASKTLDWTQNNSFTSTLNGKAGADDPASYIIDKYTDLAGYTETLSGDGKTLTYSQGGTTFFTLALSDSANSGAGSYTFTVNQPPPLVVTHFSFLDLPSGQNLQSVIAKDKTNVDTHGTATLADDTLPDGGILVFPTNPVLKADGTYDITSGTINTSKGGGDVTIGNTNQAFDNPGEGAWFVFVDNPLKSDVGGYPTGAGGIDQNTADDADTIGFTGFIESHDSSVKIVQASGKGTDKSPGPGMRITAYEAHEASVSGNTQDRAFLNDPTAANISGGNAVADEVNIVGVKIKDANGTVIEYRQLNQATGAADLASGSPDSAVNISFILDDPKGAGTADDIYSVLVTNLKANYTVEFLTNTNHNMAKVEWDSGSFDIGGFDLVQGNDTADLDFSFSVAIQDKDADLMHYAGTSDVFDDFKIKVDGTGVNNDPNNVAPTAFVTSYDSVSDFL